MNKLITVRNQQTELPMKLHPTLLDLFGAFRSRKYTRALSIDKMRKKASHLIIVSLQCA